MGAALFGVALVAIVALWAYGMVVAWGGYLNARRDLKRLNEGKL